MENAEEPAAENCSNTLRWLSRTNVKMIYLNIKLAAVSRPFVKAECYIQGRLVGLEMRVCWVLCMCLIVLWRNSV